AARMEAATQNLRHLRFSSGILDASLARSFFKAAQDTAESPRSPSAPTHRSERLGFAISSAPKAFMNLGRNANAALALALSASALIAGTVNAAGGVRWTVPPHWLQQQSRSMRVATYTVPGVQGAESAECGVFFFGVGRGGSVEENISRWSAQFEGSPKPKTAALKVHGMPVHRVDISGTYLSPAGPMMQSQGAKPNSRLLGAIVEAPGGLVFFKCVGPAPTVSAAEKEFEALIGSIEKAGSTI